MDRHDFLEGYTLYAFNLMPDEECGQHLCLIEAGNLRFETCFRQPLSHTINLIVTTETMNTVQLTAIMDKFSANTHFLGVLACDQLPERPVQKLPASLIINMHSSDLPGEHWLAVYISEDCVGWFFDSFGNKLW